MKKLIVANWKMYLTLRESVALAKKVLGVRDQVSGVDIVLCPSFVALEEVGKVIKHTKIKLGAQDVEPERRGAYTGEVGLDDLTSLHVEYVLVGHSERRQHFGETDAMVNKKLRAVLKAGMRPILCVGETSRPPTIPLPPLLTSPRAGEETSSGRRGNRAAQKYVARQVRVALRGISKQDLRRVSIAYEPIWAIGTGHPDTPEGAAKMHRYARKVLGVKNMTILYGGSVNKNNAAGFLNAPEIDGLLIGKASTDISQLRSIIKLL